MIPVSKEMQNFIDQKVQTPIAMVVAQTATDDGTKPATQTVLRKLLSYQITRSEDASSDTCKLTFADDVAEYFSSNPNGAYAPLFQPGPLDTKFMVYLGFEGCLYPNGASFVPYNRQLLLKFTGNVESDANANQAFMLDKTVSLIDLTKQFRFPVNDTFPHPLYGDQTLSYFDPTYNLKPVNVTNGTATEWVCDGKMFTTSSSDRIYGSTHIDPAVYVDQTGTTPSNTAVSSSTYTFDHVNGIVTFNTAIPSGSVVSLAGNPTYMAPEVMIRKMLVELANWDPNFLHLDESNVLLAQFDGAGKSLWDCIKLVASMTCPRFVPWQIWADENGYLNFYELQYDGPPVKTFLEGRNIITSNYENTARQLRTVVRADGTVYTNSGDQPVVSIAYNVKDINRYGQTEPLTLSTDVTQNVRHLTTTQAQSDLNMFTASTLAQVSRPVLSCQAEIWPDPSLQPGDKIAIRQSNIGMDREWIIKQTDEQSSQKKHQHNLSINEFYDTINFMIGTPAGVSGDGYAQSAATPPPSMSIIGAIRVGSGTNQKYAMRDGDMQTDAGDNCVIPVWDANDGQAMHFDVFFNSLPHTPTAQTTTPQPYNSTHLPPGYNWRKNLDLKTGRDYWYGVDPTDSTYNTYVGEDNVFYRFQHATPITPTDFNSTWTPSGNTTPVAEGGSQPYTGATVNVYCWQWWYLCLDSNLAVQNASAANGPLRNFAKFYRPLMRVNPTQDAAKIAVPATDGYWLKQTWSGAPGPQSGNTYYYGNNVVGVSDHTGTPAGFYGANVMNDGVNVGVAYGGAADPSVQYTRYQKRNKGYFCIFACNDQGQRQFLRVPFWLVL